MTTAAYMRIAALVAGAALAGCAAEGGGNGSGSNAAPPEFFSENEPFFAEVAPGDAFEAPVFAQSAGAASPRPNGDPGLSVLMGGAAAPGVGVTDGGRAPTLVAEAPAAATPQSDTMNNWLDGVAPGSSGPSAASTAPAASGGFGVQLASYKKRSAAESGWSKLSTQYGGLLDAYQRRIVQAEIPGRGTFFRLIAVGGDRPKLSGLCDQILARGGGCLLRRL